MDAGNNKQQGLQEQDEESARKKSPKITSIISIRHIVQILVTIMLVVAGWHFYQFVEFIRLGGEYVARPPVAESFLPIAGIVAFKVYLSTGYFDTVHPAGLTIFLATIITAFVFRRALCSWICPIGALSEQLARAGKRIVGKNSAIPRWLDIALLSLKYLILAAILWVFVSMPAQEAIGFMQAPFYAISDIRMFDMFANLGIAGLLFIGAMVFVSVFIKSFWCRYLCPYGALLGVLGMLSPLLLEKNDETCIHCGACNKACVNRVNIEGKKHIVVTAECVGCTSCVSACPKKGTLQFKLFGAFPLTPIAFSVGFVVLFFGIVLIAQLTGHWETSLAIEVYKSLDRAMAAGAGGF